MWWPLCSSVTVRACGINRRSRSHDLRRNAGAELAGDDRGRDVDAGEPRLRHVVAPARVEVGEDGAGVAEQLSRRSADAFPNADPPDG